MKPSLNHASLAILIFTAACDGNLGTERDAARRDTDPASDTGPRADIGPNDGVIAHEHDAKFVLAVAQIGIRSNEARHVEVVPWAHVKRGFTSAIDLHVNRVELDQRDEVSLHVEDEPFNVGTRTPREQCERQQRPAVQETRHTEKHDLEECACARHHAVHVGEIGPMPDAAKVVLIGWGKAIPEVTVARDCVAALGDETCDHAVLE